MTYTARRRLSLLVLLVGLPIYIVAAVSLVGWLGRPTFVVELAVYLGLGIVWILPFRALFRGIGQPDPNSDGPVKASDPSAVSAKPEP